jgi:tRNA A37 threonylcarbamoyladenosine dehydratase
VTERSPEATPAGESVFTLSNGQQVSLPPHDEFYRQITVRNRGLVSEADQRRLRSANILVAGCGSVGGAAIEPLVRLGAESLTLAEPDGYDLHNINRQSVRLQDVGRNKAEVFQETMRDINPYASLTVEPHGITPENVERVVQASTVILDAVDVNDVLRPAGEKARVLLARVRGLLKLNSEFRRSRARG